MIAAREADPPEYVAARRVLLDAVQALQPHKGALILAGAQAVYLHTSPGSLPIAEFTTDGDLTIDPRGLSSAPPLEKLMQAAGFELAVVHGVREPGIWRKVVEVEGRAIPVPVDLIVPNEVASPDGRRDARLRGHGKRAARKIAGLEAALVDNEAMSIEALEPGDRRSASIQVAGVAALLVAKTHKILDRIETGRTDRLSDKDGADVIRLMGANTPATVALTITHLIDDPTAGTATELFVDRFGELFGRRGGTGIELASRALRAAIPADRVQAISLAYTQSLYAALGDRVKNAPS